MNIQYITSGTNKRSERVVLWHTGEYEYELDIGSGIHKKNVKFYGIEINEALEQFRMCMSNEPYQNLETV
jgi:hypothetical protein